MKDRYDLFGSLPDTIEDDWIEDIEHLEERLRQYIRKEEARQCFRTYATGIPFSLRGQAGSCVNECWHAAMSWRDSLKAGDGGAV